MEIHIKASAMRKFSSRWVGIGLLLAVSTCWTASLKQITGFGNNPSNIKMYVYVPDKVVAHPPV